jgi:long-chain acyl-CoA synthetase
MAAMSYTDERVDLSIIENRAPHVPRLLLNRVQATPSREAFRYPEDGGWSSMTWQQAGEDVERLSAGLIALGVRPGDRVALASSTRIEWILLNLAVMMAGAATTTVYPSTSAADVGFILGDSASVLAIAEDDDQVAKVAAHRATLPGLRTIVNIDGKSDGDWVISLDELRELGAELLKQQPGAVMDRVAGLGPHDLATLIYTSGTTGTPKGVRILHSCLTYEAAAGDAMGDLTIDDLQYLWLPMAHIYGNVLLMLPLQVGFATAVDGRVEAIVPNLAVVRPTWMGAVPRVFEKVHAGVTVAVAREGGVKARLFSWAVGVATQAGAIRRSGGAVSPVMQAQLALADRLVLSKVRERFGGRMRFFNSGSAPLNVEVAHWFDAIGIPILEGYGLTETTAAAFCNRLDHREYGTVGWPLPGTEVQIAEDGEVLLRGPGVMQGYHNLPAESELALSDDGWFHTGDIGELDPRGYLRLTDRKKDLFKTSGGKYIAPAAIEALFRGLCPLASNIAVFGAGQRFATALIALDPDAIQQWAAGNGMAGRSYHEIVTSPAAHALVQGYVDRLNAGLNRWETIKRFAILERDLSIDEGELTPSLKLRRRVVGDRNAELIDSLYA